MTTYTPAQLSANALQILRPQAVRYQQIIRHHFQHRHDGRGSKAVRNWIEAYRDFKRSCGYDQHLRNVGEAQ